MAESAPGRALQEGLQRLVVFVRIRRIESSAPAPTARTSPRATPVYFCTGDILRNGAPTGGSTEPCFGTASMRTAEGRAVQ